VVFHGEALRRQAREVARAGVHIEDALTLPALEVVVMGVARGLEARVLARQVHGAQLALLHQPLEVAVDGGDAQARHLLLCRLQHLLRQQRACRRHDGLANGGALAGVSFHA
jgi:hypothetical protein